MRNMVKLLRNPIDFRTICNNENDILYKCILCKNYLSSNQYGPLLHNYIMKEFNLSKPINNTSGDGYYNNQNIEIKVSLGDRNGKLNMVHIRPDHNIDYYLVLTYNIFENDLGKIYWFKCPSDELYSLLPKYGTYAHGTIKKLGRLTDTNIYGRNCEYALRFNPNSNDNTKSKKIWNIFVDRFQIEKYNINFDD